MGHRRRQGAPCLGLVGEQVAFGVEGDQVGAAVAAVVEEADQLLAAAVEQRRVDRAFVGLARGGEAAVEAGVASTDVALKGGAFGDPGRFLRALCASGRAPGNPNDPQLKQSAAPRRPSR
ncbi:MAG: hypothetical protein WDZ46_09790 [Solirubrobacterales bacterium]